MTNKNVVMVIVSANHQCLKPANALVEILIKAENVMPVPIIVMPDVSYSVMPDLSYSVMPDAIRHPGFYWIPAFAGMTKEKKE